MKSTVPILANQGLQNELNKNGYIVVDFLSSTDVQRLSHLFEEMNANRDDIPYDRLYTCLHNPDPKYRNSMSSKIREIINPKIAAHFSDVKNTVYTFQIKGIGPNSELYAHQDWTFTREDEGYRTYTFWVSLVDSNENNGTLSVLPSSHLKLNNIRGAGIEPVLSGKQHEAVPLLTPLSMKAGQLVLFDSALLHYSAPNMSDSIRVSVMTNIMPKNADVYLYFQNKKNVDSADEYLVPDDFFLHYQDFETEYETPPSFGIKTRTVKNSNLLISKLPASVFSETSTSFSRKIGQLVKSMFHGIL